MNSDYYYYEQLDNCRYAGGYVTENNGNFRYENFGWQSL